jgi:hypothetical protein
MERTFYNRVESSAQFFENVRGGRTPSIEDEPWADISEAQREGELRILMWFFDFVDGASAEELQDCMSYIAGSSIIPVNPKISFNFAGIKPPPEGRLPQAANCTKTLTLCRDYEAHEEQQALADFRFAFPLHHQYGLI